MAGCNDWVVSVRSSEAEWITLDGAVNARVVVPGVLLRSDNLQGLSERDIDVLVGEHGLEVVIDLRTDVEVVLEGPGPLTTVDQVRIETRRRRRAPWRGAPRSRFCIHLPRFPRMKDADRNNFLPRSKVCHNAPIENQSSP